MARRIQRKPGKRKGKRKVNEQHHQNWHDRLSAFIFDFSYEIVTWVGLPTCFLLMGTFWSKDNYRGMFWSGIILGIVLLLMIGLFGDRHWFRELPPNKQQQQQAPANEPYVIFRKTVLTQPLVASKTPTIYFVLENTGQSNAKVISQTPYWHITYNPADRKLQYRPPANTTTLTILPKRTSDGVMEFEDCKLTQQQIDDVEIGKAWLFFISRSKYVDDSGKTYTLDFCRVYDKTAPGNLILCDDTVTIVDASKPERAASVTVQGVKLKEPLATGKSPLLAVHIQNSGPIPALGLHMATKIFLGKIVDETKWDNLLQATTDGIVLPPDVPDYVQYTAKWTIAQEHIDDIMGDRMYLFVIGYIDYTDAAKLTHRTTFCFQTAGKYLEEGWLRQSDSGNTAY